MAFDQTTRNRLQRFVTDARTLLNEEFTRQFQNEYGLNPETGEVSELSKLTFLDDARRETAGILRETMDHYLATTPGAGKIEVLSRIVREQAFTILNRMAALRMAEARGILMESIGNGYQSKGFQLYSYMAGSALGESGEAYQCYLFSLFDEFSLDLKVLFDRFSSQGRLFPKESSLLELLDLINHPEIEQLWAEDETIGWIYQYFNSKEERKKMRDASQAPRNSRELAVRNQFFTPRYVVEFLTDNTLGRTWYEMTQGKTSLTESCRYLVQRPNEIFLKKGEDSPEIDAEQGELSQEELLREPVHVPFRRLKDPRDLKMLDPACGSMHFGLYAFDLFEKIYDEAWDLEVSLGSENFERSKKFNLLHESYQAKENYLQDVPRLIIENNIHGVDIDPRAVQIAGLSLWLRAQKAWHEMGVNATNRPQIQKSNIVCAEPMPGEENLLKEFTANLTPRVIGQLVEIIFDKMKLAGEAGSLLKIEEEIQDAIKEARAEHNKDILRKKEQEGYLPGMTPIRQPTLFDFADLPDDEAFWNQAEQKILDALRDYAEHAEGGNSAQRRLFARDAVKGFAFIDLCRKRFDVMLMNPPFGSFTKNSKSYCYRKYKHTSKDIYSAFVHSGLKALLKNGRLGAITSSTFFNLASFEKYRFFLLKDVTSDIFINLGSGVMDAAAVSAACTIINNNTTPSQHLLSFIDVKESENKDDVISNSVQKIRDGKLNPVSNIVSNKDISSLPKKIFAYWLSNKLRMALLRLPTLNDYAQCQFGLHCHGGDEQLYRTWWEPFVDSNFLKKWPVVKLGGAPEHFYRNSYYVVNWSNDAASIREIARTAKGGTLVGKDYYFKSGLSYIYTGATFSVQSLEKGSIFTAAAHGCFSNGKMSVETMLAFLNSESVRLLLKVINPDRFFQSAYVRLLPIPEINTIQDELSSAARQSLFLCQLHCCGDECSRIFIADWISISLSKRENNFRATLEYTLELLKKRESELLLIKNKINQLVQSTYAFEESDIELLLSRIGTSTARTLPGDQDFVSEGTNSLLFSHLSYLIGIVFGRWNVRCLAEQNTLKPSPDPFTTPHICPPGMLKNIKGVPVEINELPENYPIHLSCNGILVDDFNCQKDIIRKLHEAIEVIWKNNANDMEQELCNAFNIDSLRDYFSKPNIFFANHLKRYSKKRRQAPIYWPLSTPSDSYTLWLYYHRLTDQTLYTCVNDFVDPKLKQATENAAVLRNKTTRSTQEEKDLEELINLELELTDFRDELLRIAKFWKPNLNDGVQITAAPLWKLFQHKPWQKKLKETWEKLEKGDYDWAHLAYSIWPERVKEKCKTDKSLAIAHDLEELYEEPPEKPKKKRRTKAN